jgi:parvulin-like peptidyl-prolyl isomerase
VSINNDVILESDIDRFQKKLQSKSFQELFGGVDPAATKDRNNVLQLLIEETLVDQQVKRLELQANDQEVDAQIRTILRRNGITESQLNERLKQLGTTLSDDRVGIKRQIERRNLIDREIKPSLEVTEEQLRHFYQRQASGDGKDVQYHLAHIVSNSKEKADTLYQTIQNEPGSFSAVAKESSEDSSTASAGGDLGFLSLSSLSKELKRVVTKLSPGAISSPIKTSAGYHILKLIETRTSDFATLPKEKKEAIRNQMVNSEVEKKMMLWLERKKTEAHIVRTSGAQDGK